MKASFPLQCLLDSNFCKSLLKETLFIFLNICANNIILTIRVGYFGLEI